MRSFLVGALAGAYASLFLSFRRLRARAHSNLEGLTKEDLYKRAQAADIPGRSEMTKDELIAALRKHA